MPTSPTERKVRIKTLIDNYRLSSDFFQQHFKIPYPTYMKYKAGSSAPKEGKFLEIEKFILNMTDTSSQKVANGLPEFATRDWVDGRVDQLTKQWDLMMRYIRELESKVQALEASKKKLEADLDHTQRVLVELHHHMHIKKASSM